VRPIVGITTYLEPARWGTWHEPAALVPRSYVDGVALAGGVPVLLPPPGRAVAAGTADRAADGDPVDGCAADGDAVYGDPVDGCAADCDRVDGWAADAVRAIGALVLSGGADVDPARYGEPALPTTVVRPDRDAWELALLRAALPSELPVLAICRGMQLLAVACGGTLHQHLPDVVGGTAHLPAAGVFGCTPARVAPDSRLGRILGDRVTVSCHHHQSVRTPGDGLAAVALAADGTVEAVEHTGHAFVLGVQWHPEQDTTDARLFEALVRAAVA